MLFGCELIEREADHRPVMKSSCPYGASADDDRYATEVDDETDVRVGFGVSVHPQRSAALGKVHEMCRQLGRLSVAVNGEDTRGVRHGDTVAGASGVVDFGQVAREGVKHARSVNVRTRPGNRNRGTVMIVTTCGSGHSRAGLRRGMGEGQPFRRQFLGAEYEGCRSPVPPPVAK